MMTAAEPTDEVEAVVGGIDSHEDTIHVAVVTAVAPR